jgi:hypothetical protein
MIYLKNLWSQPVFALCCVLSEEATHTNCIVFGLTRSGLKPTIYRTQGGHANRCGSNMKKYDMSIRGLLFQ